MFGGKPGKERSDKRFKFLIPTELVGIQLSVPLDRPADVADAVRSNINAPFFAGWDYGKRLLKSSHAVQQLGPLRRRQRAYQFADAATRLMIELSKFLPSLGREREKCSSTIIG